MCTLHSYPKPYFTPCNYEIVITRIFQRAKPVATIEISAVSSLIRHFNDFIETEKTEPNGTSSNYRLMGIPLCMYYSNSVRGRKIAISCMMSQVAKIKDFFQTLSRGFYMIEFSRVTWSCFQLAAFLFLWPITKVTLTDVFTQLYIFLFNITESYIKQDHNGAKQEIHE